MHDVLVIGQGAAGLAAAVSASERAPTARIALLERMAPGAAGGNTQWSPSNMRMKSLQEVAPDFESDMQAASGGRGDAAYFRTLAQQTPDTLAWAGRHGVKFHTMDYFLKSWPSRIQPVGKGAAVIAALRESAMSRGVELLYECRANELILGADGAARGVRTVDGRRFPAKAVVLATGGFQGDTAMMREHFGPRSETLRPISPGTVNNTGEGIRMGLAAGAIAAGDWKGLHVEPVDPRSERPAALVLVYPYGILVDAEGQRFFDEGSGLVHETWEHLSRLIHFEKPRSLAWTVLDSKLHDVPGYQDAIRTDVPPLEADTLAELAVLAGIPAQAFVETVARYNAACPADQMSYDSSRVDGLGTAGVSPPKSNWARPLDTPPYFAYPLAAAVVYTFGGLATDIGARVLGSQGPIRGLYAAGEMTGHFYDSAPNAVAVMRALVFGRIAGANAIDELST